MTPEPHRLRRWLIFLVLSADFFAVVGSAYGSLGVALPYMIEEMNWSWTSAGSGFTILALMSGLGSILPAIIIRHVGIRANYLSGGLLMASGFGMLALVDDLTLYFLGTFLVGLGFPLLANVPGVQVLTQWMPRRRSLAIGAFMTIGGLGGVFGPLLVTAIVEATGSWRMHWAFMAILLMVLGLLSTLIVRAAPGREHAVDDGDDASLAERSGPGKVFYTRRNWTAREALQTPQFIFVALSLTMSMFCVVTGSTWAVAHMGTLGVSTVIAAGSLSVAAAVNASSRMLGGLVATRIDPKWLLASALAAQASGMLALAVADSPLAIAIFAIGEGYGFGMSLFATTIILLNYFGSRHNAQILGIVNLLTTVAMVGPVLAGYIADTLGSIAILLQVYAGLLLLILVAVAMMRPPGLVSKENSEQRA